MAILRSLPGGAIYNALIETEKDPRPHLEPSTIIERPLREKIKLEEARIQNTVSKKFKVGGYYLGLQHKDQQPQLRSKKSNAISNEQCVSPK
ncbi:MAG: hypothetical protein H6728_01530 [Myxococcales bacterium]|nr:hypothetical protein [Myxococcales bacterium]